MSPTAKLATVTITSIGVVGGGAGAYYAKDYFLKSKPIQNNNPSPKLTLGKQLENKGKKLLINIPSYDQWLIKFSTYEREKENLNIRLDKEDAVTLRSTCESKLNSEAQEQNTKLLSDLEKICTVPTNRERLLKEGKDLVKEPQEWQQKATDYSSKRDGTNTVSELEKEDITKEDIEKWCNAKIEKDYEDDDDYSKFLRWCVKGVN